MYKDKDKQREYQRQWIANRRAEYFKDKSCVRCGSANKLELDHIDRKTKVTNSIWSWSEARRNEEIAKCQVLCSTCHKSKTRLEIPEWKGVAKHGTHSKYTLGCRCVECRIAHNASTTAWKQKQKLVGKPDKRAGTVLKTAGT